MAYCCEEWCSLNAFYIWNFGRWLQRRLLIIETRNFQSWGLISERDLTGEDGGLREEELVAHDVADETQQPDVDDILAGCKTLQE